MPRRSPKPKDDSVPRSLRYLAITLAAFIALVAVAAPKPMQDFAWGHVKTAAFEFVTWLVTHLPFL